MLPPQSEPVSTPIEDIEIKIAYLEQANAELSDVVYRQGQELESLRAQLSELVRRLDAGQTPTASSPQDEIPPHY
jgi:SlyX protein